MNPSYEDLCKELYEGECEVRKNHHRKSDYFVAELYAKSDSFDIGFTSPVTPISYVTFVLVWDNLDVRVRPVSSHQQSTC